MDLLILGLAVLVAAAAMATSQVADPPAASSSDPAPTKGSDGPEPTQAPKGPEEPKGSEEPTKPADDKTPPTKPGEKPPESYEPSPKMAGLLRNVTGLARAKRQLERENAELRAKEKPAAAPAPELGEDGLPKELERSKDDEGKPIVRYLGDWMSPELVKDLLDQKAFREGQVRDREEAEAKERAARAAEVDQNLALGVEQVVEQIAAEDFPHLEGDDKRDVQHYYVGLADRLIADALEQGIEEGKDPLELMGDPSFLRTINKAVRERGKRVFGAFAEAQARHNAELAQQHPVTRPTGASGVEPRMTMEDFDKLPPAEQRKIMAGIKDKHDSRAAQ